MLRITRFSKQFSISLFDAANLLIRKGEKVALIGQNGTGKSTLMKCIVGEEDFEGTIELNGTVSLMEQEKEFEKSEHCFTAYLDSKHESVEKKKQEYEERLGTEFDDTKKYSLLIQEYQLLCARVTEKLEESNIRTVLNDLQFEMEDYGKRIIDLSGGQRTKLRLAECLSRDADFLILDEPTNHLDFDTLRWLEHHLNSLNKTMLIVSHDRYFLSRIANRVVEIENQGFQVYNCDYASYTGERALHLHALTKKHHATEKERKRLLDSAAEKRKWASKNADRGMKLLADKLERRANELPSIPNPDEFIKEFALNFESTLRPSDVVFSVKDVCKSFSHPVFEQLNLEIDRGDKVAIIGPNGSGKTTLLTMLNGVEPSSGSITVGHNVKLGYFDQEFKSMKMNQRVKDFLLNSLTHIDDHRIMSMATKFNFPKEKFQNRLKTLSGGEKARINLLRLLNERCNVLLLDEPTNNLDLELTRALEKSLVDYKGTVIFVSHDRYFIDKVATKVVVIESRGVQVFEGSGWNTTRGK